MAYRAELETGQTVFLSQEGEQTLIRVQDGEQRQSSGFQTGVWRQPPRLYRSGRCLLLELRAEPPVYYSLEGQQLRSLTDVPALEGAEQLELNEAPESAPDDDHDGGEMKPMKKMEPMKPMEPLKPM